MSFRRQGNVGRMLLVIATLVALLGATVGVMHPMAGPSSAMVGCSFADHAGMCPMNPLDHLAAWQNAFTADILHMTLLIMLVGAIFYTVVRGFSFDALYPRRAAFPPRSDLVPPDPDFLERAFSRGILHSRAW